MNKEFFAVFVESSYYTPGDERSRTHPGHGYPASTTKYTEVIEFKDKEELTRWIIRENDSYAKRKFRVVRCSEITFTKTVSWDIVG